MPNKTSFPIHDPLLSLAEIYVVCDRLPVSTSSGNSGHGWEDLDVLYKKGASV